MVEVKIFWYALTGILFLLVLSNFIFRTQTTKVTPSVIPLEKEFETRLDQFAQNIVSGGPPKDGIPPIDKPVYVSREEADKFLKDSDIVFGINYKGVVKAYPQKILVWHEVVNDKIGEEKISVTYCPLTGSIVAFKGKEFDFGTSGRLVNSNLLMYDRQTDSNWPQILAVAINGEKKGTSLEEFPVIWTTWGRWKTKFPNTLVLSQQTGFLRPYGSDPYGSYDSDGTYYQTGGPFFPVMHSDYRFPEKKVFIGVKENNAQLAIPKEEFKTQKLANLVLGGKPILAAYDGELDDVRVFSRIVDGGELNFEIKNGKIIDKETKSIWNFYGEAVEGNLKNKILNHVSSFDVMWFAWVSFFPNTEVYGQ